MKRTVRDAGKKFGKTKTAALLEMLERRLDNVVFRIGLAPSRRIAQHLVSYGFIAVNGKPCKIPSRQIRPGDKIEIRAEKHKSPLVHSLLVHLKKHQPPEWLTLNSEAGSGEMKRLPSEEDESMPRNLNKVIEYYSR